jgi:phosphatidylinositol alpha-mannosyltransferase
VSTVLRVGIVCPYSWDVPGGVQTHVRDLAHALMDHGHVVSVLAPGDDEPDEDFVYPAGRAVPVHYNGSVARLAFGPLSAQRVRRWIDEGAFDVLHVHEPAAPSVSLVACWAAEGPMVGTFHTSNPRSRAMTVGANILQTAVEKLGARIAVSEPARQTLREHLGVDSVVIPNGVDVTAYAEAKPLEVMPAGSETVAFLGRLDEPRKGFEVLARAIPAIVRARPQARFLVVGPGDPEEALAGLPGPMVERIHLLGRVSDEDKARALATADVFVAPNTGGESFGIVLLEAMSAGAPVVASDLEAFARVLDHGRVGRLFPNGDAQALARSVVELLQHPEQRAELSDAGLHQAYRFDWSRVVDDVLAVYDTVRAPGLVVREDARGTALGRLSRWGRSGSR